MPHGRGLLIIMEEWGVHAAPKALVIIYGSPTLREIRTVHIGAGVF